MLSDGWRLTPPTPFHHLPFLTSYSHVLFPIITMQVLLTGKPGSAELPCLLSYMTFSISLVNNYPWFYNIQTFI